MLQILDPVHHGQGEMDKGGRARRVLGGRFHKQGNLHIRLVLVDLTMRSPHAIARVLRVYKEALLGLSPLHHPDGFISTLFSQIYVLETLPVWE